MSASLLAEALTSLPRASGDALGDAIVRAEPEDFEVREWLGYEPDGEGEHLLLRVRKRGANTLWVAKQLARMGKINPRDVGFAGMKDRHAVTEQSFSMPLRNARGADWLNAQGEGFEVVGCAPHRRKLKRGALRGNEFVLTLRGLVCDLSTLEERLRTLRVQGAPNYFGAQRFGKQGSNLAVALRWFSGTEEPRDRFERGYALSAARAAIFNAVLAQRVSDGTWNRVCAGDLANLDGTNSFFAVEQMDAELVRRAVELDIHPTGPLWSGVSGASGAVAQLETAAAARFDTLARGLAVHAPEPERRPLRVRVEELAWTIEAGDAGHDVRLSFRLRRGSFATAVLHELIANAFEDAGPDADD